VGKAWRRRERRMWEGDWCWVGVEEVRWEGVDEGK
jgi:hypothetical protein